MTTMLALAIFGIFFAIAFVATFAIVVAYNSLPMDKTPEWLDRLYDIVTFGRG